MTAQWSLISYIQNYSYTGASQTFTAPYAGYYELKVYGAQGGAADSCGDSKTYPSGTNSGANGGYAIGNKFLDKGATLYVIVGGKGSDKITSGGGGYNGGGNGSGPTGCTVGGGGGMTHISTTNNVATTSWSTTGTIIVAGGGGGAEHPDIAGAGGGASGGEVQIFTTGVWLNGYAGTQTSGYKQGVGESSPHSSCSTNNSDQGGGGAGWWGGKITCSSLGGYNAGAGGSGYIGGVTSGSMQNGVRSGNGYAEIKWLGVSI